MSFNRWSYGYGNPDKYTDPSGRTPIMDGSNWWRYPSYGIYFVGEWNASRLLAVDNAIQDVGDAFRRAINQFGRDKLDAFETVYQTRSTPLILLYGDNFDPEDCSQMNTLNKMVRLHATAEIGSGGITFEKVSYYTDDGQKVFARMIKFASMSGEYQHTNIFKMRNNVVHELGHLFNISIEARGWYTPYDALARDMGTNKDLTRGTDPNETYGFASPGNIVTWQQHSCYMDDLSKPYPPCILSGEIFADQFLGWTYDAWDGTFDPVTQTYKLSDRGKARSDWMDENMRRWLITIFGRSNH